MSKSTVLIEEAKAELTAIKEKYIKKYWDLVHENYGDAQGHDLDNMLKFIICERWLEGDDAQLLGVDALYHLVNNDKLDAAIQFCTLAYLHYEGCVTEAMEKCEWKVVRWLLSSYGNTYNGIKIHVDIELFQMDTSNITREDIEQMIDIFGCKKLLKNLPERHAGLIGEVKSSLETESSLEAK